MKTSLGRIKQFLFSREGIIFGALVIAAIVVRIPLMTFRGYYADLSTYLRWGETVTQHFTSIYTTTATASRGGPGGFGGFPLGPGRGFPGGNGGGFPGGSFNNAINYPPAIPYLFGAMASLYNQFLEPIFHASFSTLAAANGIGALLFSAVTIVSGIHIWRHREPFNLCLGLAVQAFGFFFFMGGQHERYLFLFIPLALASLILAPQSSRPHLITLYVLGTLLCFLNMVIGVGGGSFGNSQPIPFVSTPALSAYLITNLDAIGQWLALLHLSVFVYLLYVYLVPRFAPAARPEPSRWKHAPQRAAAMLAKRHKIAPVWYSMDARLCNHELRQQRRLSYATRPASAHLSGADGCVRRASHPHHDP